MTEPRDRSFGEDERGRPPTRHIRARADRSRETAEDYVEAVADVIAEKGEARVVDLARFFAVSHVTVSRTVSRLQRGGLVCPVEMKTSMTPVEGRGQDRQWTTHRARAQNGVPKLWLVQHTW